MSNQTTGNRIGYTAGRFFSSAVQPRKIDDHEPAFPGVRPGVAKDEGGYSRRGAEAAEAKAMFQTLLCALGDSARVRVGLGLAGTWVAVSPRWALALTDGFGVNQTPDAEGLQARKMIAQGKASHRAMPWSTVHKKSKP